MKPFNGGKPVANWLLRISLIAILCVLYFNIASTLNFRNLSFIIAILALIFGALNIVGGVLSRPGLTILSGLIIFLLSLYKLVISFNGRLDSYFALQLVPLSLGFYFFAYGND
jgi:hypothetical protein